MQYIIANNATFIFVINVKIFMQNYLRIIINLDKNINEIFTNICKPENHYIKLEFFCKAHSQLYCGACLSKIKMREMVSIQIVMSA